MAVTYEKIATTTLGSDTATITFSSISGSYTDLVAICDTKSNDANFRLRLNSDSGSNYSRTVLTSNGSTAESSRQTSQTYMRTGDKAYMGNLTSLPNNRLITIINFMNYSNTTTYKTVLCRGNNAALGLDTNVGLWRNTSAITAIEFSADNANLYAGSNITLYGILKA